MTWKLLMSSALALCSFDSNSQPMYEHPPMVIDPNAIAISMGSMLNSEQERELLMRAEEGDGDAAFRLKAHFSSKREPVLSRYWQLRAALSGNPKAQYAQWMVLNESNDCASMGEALAWLESSERAGDSSAKEALSKYRDRIKSCVP